jgi:hypothetical protein
MAHDAHAGVGGQHTFDACRGFSSPIRHDHHAGMLAVADAHAAAVMEADPAGAPTALIRAFRIGQS